MTNLLQPAPASRSPLRICFVGLGNLPLLARPYSHLRAGGAELQQTLLARALARGGWHISMVVADCGQPDGAVWDAIKTYKAYRADEGVPGIRFLHPRWTKLRAAMARADAQIYYASCAGGQLGQVVQFAHARGRKAVFRIASDSDCDPRSLLVRYWRDRQLYRWGLRRADLVLAQSPAQQAALARNFGRDSLCLDSLLETSGAALPLQARDIGALWVGNLRPLKRPQLFLEAAARLPALSFHMIGGPMPGAQLLFEECRARALALPNVTFHGFVPQHEIAGYFDRARVFVGTSEVEGFPNTYLQAWGSGTPVVAFLDPQDLIRRNGLGAVVSSAEELCAAIARLAADTPDRQGVSARARGFIEARTAGGNTLSEYEEALSGLLRASATGIPVATRKPWHISSPG
jgi:glycosyltransferase involved in cell wall biosynthesis